MASLLAGTQLQLQDGSKVDAAEHLKGKMVALYFSAGWCPPCRAYTPKLKRFYEHVAAAGKPFEVVFVSKDKEEDDLNEYFEEKHGDWAAIPFGDPKIVELLEKYEVKTIPAMKVITPDGEVKVADARTEVAEKGGDSPDELYESWEAFYDM